MDSIAWLLHRHIVPDKSDTLIAFAKKCELGPAHALKQSTFCADNLSSQDQEAWPSIA